MLTVGTRIEGCVQLLYSAPRSSLAPKFRHLRHRLDIVEIRGQMREYVKPQKKIHKRPGFALRRTATGGPLRKDPRFTAITPPQGPEYCSPDAR